MDRSRLELSPGLWLDASRAVWIEAQRTLVVADLHLGYAWAHRAAGQLLPLGIADDTHERLLALSASYRAREIVLLGDVVHAAVQAPALEEDVRRLFRTLGGAVRVRVVLGNHDAHLPALLARAGIEIEAVRQLEIGPHSLLHGDGPDAAGAAAFMRSAGGGKLIIGHEHPSITISDGITSSLKCPCFLASPELLVLPAFSRWAAGCNIRERRFLSPFARRVEFDRSIAIMGNKLLPLRL